MKKKKYKYDKDKMIKLFKEEGFSDEEIKKHFEQKKNLEIERKKLIKKQKEKPLARIFNGLNTNAI
jgi:uncharacterized protein Smg (DUF494 family)